MNKRFFIFSAAILAFAGMSAQTSGIDAVLQQIEANNKELQANSHLISSQKLENKTNNNLPDPTLSYAHLWDSKNSDETVGEMVISQSFDFPTLYATRGKMNRLKTNALDAQATAFRQQILLQAKEVCLDIIMLQRQQALLDERLKNAEELSAMYTRRLETGDANALETNKINLELLNVRTEARMNQTALNNKLKELLVLNGNQPLTPGRPRPDTTPDAQTLGLTEYPAVPLPADFHPLADELLASDPTLQSLQGESSAARKQISASKQGWLPKLELGYRRNTESGHPLNGVVVGFSFPLFENRNKVKIAKTQALNIDYQKENAALQASSALWQLYEEAKNLHASMEEYERTFHQQQDLSLLKQALMGGQISMIEYFVEISVVYQSKTNLLQKIKKEEWVPFIVNAFHRTNKEISEQQAEQLCDIVKCHSWYLQQLCYFIWSGTSEKVTDEIIEIRTRQLIDTNMPMFMNDTENLTAAQTAMLRAVADGEYRFNSIPVVRKYELGSAQTITRNKRMLTERDFIEKEGNKYAFSDPIFELWFRREYC